MIYDDLISNNDIHVGIDDIISKIIDEININEIIEYNIKHTNITENKAYQNILNTQDRYIESYNYDWKND